LDRVTGWIPRSYAVCFWGFTGSDQDDRAGTELCGIRAWHDGQPFVQAVT
jgi:hypothetical protein